MSPPQKVEVESMGAKFQRLRKLKNLSQSQLAKKAQVPIGTLRNWEQDRRVPRLDAAARVAKILGVSLDELALTLIDSDTAD